VKLKKEFLKGVKTDAAHIPDIFFSLIGHDHCLPWLATCGMYTRLGLLEICFD
jgi:hypothetical protein